MIEHHYRHLELGGIDRQPLRRMSMELSKRLGADEALTTMLPYSKTPFGVPVGIHLIGTMNTADRSLASIDMALRRRFVFEEIEPQPETLDEIELAGVNVGALLSVMNARIEALLDREHRLGHAYFLHLEAADDVSQLKQLFSRRILPLLREYFFDDWQRIRLGTIQSILPLVRFKERSIRFNSSWLLAKVVDETTLCGVLNEVSELLLDDNTRYNLWQVVKVVAEDAGPDNKAWILKTIERNETLLSGKTNYGQTLALMDDVKKAVAANTIYDPLNDDQRNACLALPNIADIPLPANLQ
ncbi:hypothetical protein [Ensifer sp. YR511]|uniref:hypothetical protein n=1 Tax=Ensifer sp. YR511 TaxID=1855294 RepID=UPI001FCD02A0|nr:hypothetical protein [Ensifer sp. YR511]